MFARLFTAVLVWTAVSFSTTASAEAVISIIIDDLGDHLSAGERAAALPGPVNCAVLPATPYAGHIARLAHAAGKEVMLHLPMESTNGARLGPGALTLHMSEREFLRTLRRDLDGLPFVAGINNHMGSLLTRHPGSMAWLMRELKQRGGLFFVDSRTTAATVAARLADEYSLPVASRDVFLDNDPRPAAIRARLDELVALARARGSALGIGHPYPGTLAVLEQYLPRLGERHVSLVPVSNLIAMRNPGRTQIWQASLSPSPKAVKNSKP